MGDTQIDYIDIMRTIKRVKGLKTIVLPIPFAVFDGLLRLYALVTAGRLSRRRSFTRSRPATGSPASTPSVNSAFA